MNTDVELVAGDVNGTNSKLLFVNNNYTNRQEQDMKKRFDLSNIDFVEFDNMNPKFVFTDKSGDKQQVEMSVDGVHPGSALFASLLVIEKHLAKE